MPPVTVYRKWGWWRWRFADGRVSRYSYSRRCQDWRCAPLDDLGRTPLAPHAPLGSIEWIGRQLETPAQTKARCAQLPPVIIPHWHLD